MAPGARRGKSRRSRRGDRGHNLSDVWKDEGGKAEAEEPAAPGEPAPEPVNRGLLLKFLGSARN